MRVTGIIAEYNPLHGGHISQIRRIRDEYDSDYIIVAMSGDFVQRGEPAIYDKAVRAKAALLAGADLVIEIPVIFSTASATDFAGAGVALLDKLGVVTDLCFGSECGDLGLLESIADIMLKEPDNYKETLHSCLKDGDAYPKAQAEALKAVLKCRGLPEETDIQELFSSPNNILGIEYLKSLRTRNSSIDPLTYKREGQPYNDDSPVFLDSDNIPSASAIRNAVRVDGYDYPGYLGRLISSDDLPSPITPVFPDDLSSLLNTKLLDILYDGPEDMASERLNIYSSFSPELANRLSHQILDFDSFTARCSKLKSRSYTYARISRALLHIILGISNDDVNTAKENDYISYIRVLGFRKSSEDLLKAIHEASPLPIITKTAGAQKVLSADGCRSFSRDLYASHLYESLEFSGSGILPPNEFTRPLIIV